MTLCQLQQICRYFMFCKMSPFAEVFIQHAFRKYMFPQLSNYDQHYTVSTVNFVRKVPCIPTQCLDIFYNYYMHMHLGIESIKGIHVGNFCTKCNTLSHFLNL